MKDGIQIFKDILASVRELFILLIFIFVLFFPEKVNTMLLNAGFTEGDVGPFKWKAKVETLNNDSRKVGTLVSQITDEKIPLINNAIESLEKKIKDPALMDSLQNIKKELSGIKTVTRKADDLIQSSIIQQETILNFDNGEPTVEGWFYAGHVTENKKEWADLSSRNIDIPKPPTKAGETVLLDTDTYLRKDTGKGFYTKSSVISVLKEKTKVDILDTGYTHALKGGYFLWLKVQK
jgi:hypothetical protein